MLMTGRCLCGAVSYAAEDVETDIHACHCGLCRRWSGAAILAAPVGKVEFDGVEHIRCYRSSEWAERGFCERCGTNLFHRAKESGQHHIWLGTFDDESPFKLVGEIYIEDKPNSYNFAGEHPRLTGAEFLASLGHS